MQHPIFMGFRMPQVLYREKQKKESKERCPIIPDETKEENNDQ